jgi:hypothetical protein
MVEREAGADHGWDAGWDAHGRAQRRRLAALPMSEKLRWLEQSQRLATHLLRPRQVVRSEDDEPPTSGRETG